MSPARAESDCPKAAQRGGARSRAARLLVGAGRVTSRTPTPPSPWSSTLGGVQRLWQGGEGSPGWLQHRERGVRVKWVEARWASSRDAEASGCKAVSAPPPGREAAHAKELSRGVLPASSISWLSCDPVVTGRRPSVSKLTGRRWLGLCVCGEWLPSPSASSAPGTPKPAR